MDFDEMFKSIAAARVTTQPTVMPSFEEILALRVIVTKLVALMAETNPKGLVPQGWVNSVAADCSDTVTKATIDGSAGLDVDKVRAGTLSQIKNILSGALVSKDGCKMN